MVIKKASFWKRLSAFFVDGLIVLVISRILQTVLILSNGMYDVLSTALVYVYFISMEAYRQQTLGKMLLKIKVIAQDGSEPDLWTSTSRNFGKMISALPMAYGFVRILAPHRIQTTHDEFAKCYVVEA